MPGVDFKEVYSLVIHDMTVRLLIIVALVLGLDYCLVDVKIAFLHGILGKDETIYMDCPAGMECETDECLQLINPSTG